jgi:hypothetical protein
MTAPEFSSASADAGAKKFANFRQLLFFTRACSQSTKASTLTTGVSESPQAIKILIYTVQEVDLQVKVRSTRDVASRRRLKSVSATKVLYICACILKLFSASFLFREMLSTFVSDFVASCF